MAMKPNFSQFIDITRPHTLLTVDSKHNGSLEYRYDDTNEVVTVPNIWYNQTYQTRVEYVLWLAKLKDEAAQKYRRAPPHTASESDIDRVVAQLRASASRIRSEAGRMEAAGSATHPVAASHMQLDFDVDATLPIGEEQMS